METKELKIEIPEGFEIDKSESTFDKIVFKKKKKSKKLTYEQICNELFNDTTVWYIDKVGEIVEAGLVFPYSKTEPNNLTSSKQAEKILALIKLMNTATYLNKGWKPDWNSSLQEKYYIYNSSVSNQLTIYASKNMQESQIYFKSFDLAKQAIEILGEDVIRLALSTDY